jgi:hypothetical protein
LFNKDGMDAANNGAKGPNLSSAKSIGFRPGPLLAAKITALQTEVSARGGSLDTTDVIRDGLLGCWDQVRTHLLVRHTTSVTTAPDVARLVAIGQRALEQGLTPDQVEEHFTRLIEQKLAG